MVPTITNQVLTSGDTEYSVTLTNCRQFAMQCRTGFDVRFSFEIGKVAGSTSPYATMKSGSTYESPVPVRGVESDLILYLASAQAGVVVEIVSWT